MWKTYITASSVEEVTDALAKYGEKSRVVAGATDLILEIDSGIRTGIDVLIDVTRIPELDKIWLDDDDNIHLGPMVTHNDCAASALIRERALPLAQSSWQVGAPQIRNRSTVAGNLVTASPANDTIPPLMALGASLVLRSSQGERNLALQDFYAGIRKTVMRPDEMLVDIIFPAIKTENQRAAFLKIALRQAQAISVVNAAIVLSFDGQKISAASATLGAVTPVIVHASEMEKYLKGKTLDDATIVKAAGLALNAAAPIDDVRSTAKYRREMVKVAISRLLNDLAQSDVPLNMPEHPIILNGLHPAPAIAASSVHQDQQSITTTINGVKLSLDSGQDKTLLRWLREDALMIGTKEGCAEGECGACTVFLDGEAVMSCLVPAPRAHGAEITSIEGLATEDKLHPVQQAFIDHAAVQCGYCTPGFIMSAAKLLEEQPSPNRDQAQQAITGNLCRCTGYYKILDAIQDAGKMEL
jgi:carbon-monoxide dehydrogenase medium subunit